jgi:hypothetical protein
MTTPIPWAERRLPALYSDVAETLKIVALRKPVLGSMNFDFYSGVK